MSACRRICSNWRLAPTPCPASAAEPEERLLGGQGVVKMANQVNDLEIGPPDSPELASNQSSRPSRNQGLPQSEYSQSGAQSLPPRKIRVIGVPLDLGASRR